MEVKDSLKGLHVPQHLFDFAADGALSTFYRGVLKNNYNKGLESLDLGLCALCFRTLSVWDKPRMKPRSKMTSKIHKFIKKSARKELSKNQTYTLKKFFNSSQHIVVKCSSCGCVNKKSIMSTKDLILHKKECLSKAIMSNESESKGSQKLKKKKKKKLKQDQKSEQNSLSLEATENSSKPTLLPSLAQEKMEKKKMKKRKKKKADPETTIIVHPLSLKRKRKAMANKDKGKNTLANFVQTKGVSQAFLAKTAGRAATQQKKTVTKQLKSILSESKQKDSPVSLKHFLSSL